MLTTSPDGLFYLHVGSNWKQAQNKALSIKINQHVFEICF